MSPLDSEEFVVVRGLLLGLRVVVGRIYTAGDLRRRCNGNSAILRRLEKYLVDPTILQPVKLSCTALHKELFSNITKQGLHRRRSSLRKPLAELIGQLDGVCHGVNMSMPRVFNPSQMSNKVPQSRQVSGRRVDAHIRTSNKSLDCYFPVKIVNEPRVGKETQSGKILSAWACKESKGREDTVSFSGVTESEGRAKKTKVYRFLCDLCSFRTYTRAHLRRHKWRHHQQGNPQRCKECDYTCWTAKELVQHKKAKHDGGQCPYCFQWYSQYSTLKTHVQFCLQVGNSTVVFPQEGS